MICDKLKNLADYAGLGFDCEKIQEFVKKAQKEHLPAGRYELDGENLFVMIQEYTTKEADSVRYEAHEKYADIQYVAEGEEYIYYAPAEDLELEEAGENGADICFFKSYEKGICLDLPEGVFAMFLPQDGHKPCCNPGSAQRVRKFVFKVLVK